ncbi:MAG: InlB B-repeat-containing protein [Aristaeellaceae bacterium]
MLCTCCINSDGTVSDEILHQPYGQHAETCPWYKGSFIVPPIPEQPKLYEGEPNGNQYISSKEYTLPMTRAIILPESGLATIHSKAAAGYNWQVYDGANWVDIAGETGADLVITTAKLQTIFNRTGIAQLRYYDKANSIVLASVDVTSQAIAGGEYPEETTQTLSVETRGSDANGNETPATYNVVINYRYENNEIVADPYTASLAAGSSFSATVTFPTVQGYLPYLNEVQQNSLKLDITGIDQDYTYNVVYKPTNVDYTVIHYQQNLDDDNYTVADTETKQGLTNSTVPEVAKSYEGFYALLYEKPAIAADGSTEVEVYYDRYYYLMNFDLDGGYGVEPIYARYGAPIGDVGTPKKAGYTFQGWTLNGVNATVPGTMPAENRTYKAVWEANATAKVTVVFWGENADDEEYSYIKSAEVNVKPGMEFTYSESGVLICALEVHTHSIANGCYTLTCTQEEHTHSESCYTCGQTEHTTHSIGCYEGVGNRQDVYTGVPNNPVDGQVADHWFYGKLIYINGSWYKYSGSTEDGQIAPSTCHKHSTSCLGCGKTEHTHSVENNCYSLTCTKPEHSHTSDCYMGGAGLDSSLWTFVKSDTVTVAADGSTVVNVYYDRTEKTLTFKYNYKNNNYQSTETITAKWGADISEQYKKIAENAGSTFWSAQTGGDGPYTNYFGIMPQTSATYYNRGNSGSDGTMTYWGQDLNGEYTVKLFEVTGVGGYYVSDEDRYEFEGFTYHHGTGNGSSCSGAAFYYTRNSYTLTFNDGYNDVKSETVLFEAPLSTYSDYKPNAPSAYETGSVTFGGWYLNPECSGEEYKLTEHTMPAENVLLYAKWVPVKHNVTFFLRQEDIIANSAYVDTFQVSHRDTVVKAEPSIMDRISNTAMEGKNGSYTFVGWFYMDEGVEKAFDPATMPVTKDLQVYGKWSSNVLKTYTIYYKYKDTDGNEIEIADPTTGSGLAGVTKTFEAKGGTELYADYQEGYFPVVKSHSMTIDINDTEENDTNVYTFWYVQKNAVPYTVYYLTDNPDADPTLGTMTVDGKEYTLVAETKTVDDNRKAVVTETFVPVSGYLPDAYQKRLVVSAEAGAVNEIIFYYTKDTTHAYYKITHYTENLGTDAQGKPTWTEYASSQAVGDIGTTYTADPMTIPGFSYDETVAGTVKGGELTANGLDLKLYYTRNSYPYQVRYLEQGNPSNVLHAPKDSTGKYGQVISENAITIENYDLVSDTPQNVTIKIEETATQNVITFYYKEKEATINYEVVGPTDCGTVSLESETLKVLTGTAQGSTATASSNTYKFVGWYEDEACTKPVQTGWVDANNKITPQKQDVDNNSATAPVYVAATYYAKFEYNVADLTISKSGLEAGDSAIFTVTVHDPNGIVADEVFTIVLTGPGTPSATIKDLQIGYTYSVVETSWSWRYTGTAPSNASGTIQVSNPTVTFRNTSTDKWLYDESAVRNVFNKN